MHLTLQVLSDPSSCVSLKSETLKCVKTNLGQQGACGLSGQHA